MKRSINKPYDILTGKKHKVCDLSTYTLFVFVKDFEEYGEDVPIYLTVPAGRIARAKYRQLGQSWDSSAKIDDDCYTVIAR